jgi:G:T-mismatch repair DNA endonuclease (very short patch repair protein)
MMTRRRLEEGGWTSLTVWECQLADRDQLKQALVDFLETL